MITCSYGTSGGMNDLLNRVDTIQDTTSGTTALASYAYLGAGSVVQIDYPQPQVNLDLWGGVTGVFNGFDRFGRIINQPWNNYGTSTMLDQYKYGYDLNSNRVWKANVVGTPVVTNGLDEFYTYDHLNRLTDMKRGTLNSSTTPTGISGTPTIEQDWTLDATGNWHGYLTKAAGTTDLDQTRTNSTVNEITGISNSVGPVSPIVPLYDSAGNTTFMPTTADPTLPFTAVYDAWNRMVQISDSSYTVAGYQYDGWGRRIARLGYTSGTLTETRHFYFTNSGRDIEQRVGASTSMDQQHVWGIRYINELICRDDATPARFFVCQDANFNVTALVNSSGGTVALRFVYTPYGIFMVLSSSWTSTAYTHNWVYLFQGGRYDALTELYVFGRRDLGPNLGVWLQRDGEYWDAMNLYLAMTDNPVAFVDPSGMAGTYPVNTDRGKFYIDIGGAVGGPFVSDVTIRFYPDPDVIKKCLCTEIKFVQIVKTWDWGDIAGVKYKDWHVDDANSNQSPFYSQDAQTPWTLKGIYKYAQLDDNPGSGSWAPQEVKQWFETGAFCTKGKEAGTLYGVVYWGQDLLHSWSLRWASPTGEMGVVQNTPAKRGQPSYPHATGPGQSAGGSSDSINLPRVRDPSFTGGQPSAKFRSLVPNVASPTNDKCD